MRRFFRILKWCVLGVVGIVGIFLIVNGVRTALASSRLEARTEALRAAGEPTSLAELTRPAIPPERNADTYLRRAREDATAIESEVYAASDKESEADQNAFEDGRPTPALRQTMRAALAAHPEVMPLIVEASNCPDYDPQLNFQTDSYSFFDVLLKEVQYCRTAFRVCNFQVLVQLDEGHPEDAMQTCLAMFRLTRLTDRDPGLMSQLVSIAIRGVAAGDANLVLQSGPLPQADYAALEQELARFDVPERVRQSLRSERAYGLQSFHDMASGCAGGGCPGGGCMATTVRLMPWFKNDMCDYLDMMAEYIQIAALPYGEWNSAANRLSMRSVGPLTGLILPALQQAHNSMTRIEAEFRTLRVLNALLAREQAGDTAEPVLADLGLPADVTTDPFNGEPLHLKKLPDGWLVYSVGPNLKDDGGDLLEYHDVGVGPPTAAKVDSDEPTPPQKPAE